MAKETDAERKAREEAEAEAKAKAEAEAKAAGKIRFTGPKNVTGFNIAGREYSAKNGVLELDPGFTDAEVENLVSFGFVREA